MDSIDSFGRSYFVLVGAIGLVLGVFFLLSRIGFRINGTRCTGVVVRKQIRHWSGVPLRGGGFSEHLVIKYLGNCNEECEFVEQNSLATYLFKIGDSVNLLKDRKAGGRIMLNNQLILYSAPILIIAISVVFLGVLLK